MLIPGLIGFGFRALNVILVVDMIGSIVLSRPPLMQQIQTKSFLTVPAMFTGKKWKRQFALHLIVHAWMPMLLTIQIHGAKRSVPNNLIWFTLPTRLALEHWNPKAFWAWHQQTWMMLKWTSSLRRYTIKVRLTRKSSLCPLDRMISNHCSQLEAMTLKGLRPAKSIGTAWSWITTGKSTWPVLKLVIQKCPYLWTKQS